MLCGTFVWVPITLNTIIVFSVIGTQTPLLVLIKMIIVKFLLKITTMKIQSDCFGIKCSRKRPTDVAFSRLYTYNTYIITHGVEM